MAKRKFEEPFHGDAKRVCFEIQQGQKRTREDDDMDYDVPETKHRSGCFGGQSGHNLLLDELREENVRLRAELFKNSQTINYGRGELSRLNAQILSQKQQLHYMEQYVANMEGRSIDWRITSH